MLGFYIVYISSYIKFPKFKLFMTNKSFIKNMSDENLWLANNLHKFRKADTFVEFIYLQERDKLY